MNTCWNDLKVDFFTNSVCDGDLFDGDIINWSNNCTEEDGSWIAALREDKSCQYQITCAPEMQQQLKLFAECSCDAAAASGYTGDFIATAMETLWSRFCPNIEISCAISENLGEATSKLIYKYFRVSYPILIGMYGDEITDAVEEIIVDTVADALNIDPDLINLEITGTFGDVQSTSIVITVDVEDYATKEFMVSIMNGDLAVKIEAASGATVSNEAASSEEIEEEVEYKTESAGNRLMVMPVVVLFLMMALFL